MQDGCAYYDEAGCENEERSHQARLGDGKPIEHWCTTYILYQKRQAE